MLLLKHSIVLILCLRFNNIQPHLSYKLNMAKNNKLNVDRMETFLVPKTRFQTQVSAPLKASYL